MSVYTILTGYFCTLGAHNSTPTDGVTGDICPVGFYCPENSTAPTACPQGTYLNTTGNSVQSSCIDCVPGMYYVLRQAVRSPPCIVSWFSISYMVAV